jgi:hypothetical protein
LYDIAYNSITNDITNDLGLDFRAIGPIGLFKLNGFGSMSAYIAGVSTKTNPSIDWKLGACNPFERRCKVIL